SARCGQKASSTAKPRSSDWLRCGFLLLDEFCILVSRIAVRCFTITLDFTPRGVRCQRSDRLNARLPNFS
ncbi:MAG: hypothetical protein ACRELW_18370, partial [Candidatus Rokuibacteriota bacterium]